MTTQVKHQEDFIGLSQLLKPADVAALLKLSRSFTYKLLKTGELPAVRFGRTYRVRPKDLFTYIQRNLHGIQE